MIWNRSQPGAPGPQNHGSPLAVECQMLRSFPFFRFFAALSFLVTVPTFGQSTLLWDIGKNDGSAREFSAGPSPRLLYRVGSSKAKTDWPATQSAGSSYEIDFPLRAA